MREKEREVKRERGRESISKTRERGACEREKSYIVEREKSYLVRRERGRESAYEKALVRRKEGKGYNGERG